MEDTTSTGQALWFLRVYKGKCLYEIGRLEESRIALEKAVKLRPYYGIAKHNRNILMCKLGKQYRARVALSINKKRVF